MSLLQVGTWGPFLLFTVLPGVALAAAITLSAYEVYRIGERKLLILIVILALMLQHQFLEAYTFVQGAGSVSEGLGEVFETGANLVASGSVSYVLRFARRERRLVRELAESERQHRNLIDESPVPMLLHDDEEIQYANDAAVELFDAETPSAVTGTDLAAFLADERPEEVRRTVLTDGGTDVVESEIETLEDRSRYAALSSVPADYEADDVRQVVLRDLTERKRREREYEQIFNGVHDTIVIHDPETGEMLDVNDSLCELLGYDRERILEWGVEGISVTEEGFTEERAQEIIDQVMAEGERGPFEWKVETSDGDHRLLEVRATTAEIGGQRRHLSINRDITEQRRREREFEQIFNSVNDAISINDPETGAILQVNDTMCELLGYDREEILELGVDGVSKTEEGFTQEHAKAFFDEVVDGERAEQTQWAVETSDGETRWLETSATRAEIGGEPRLITTNRDITERKRREREYEQIYNTVSDAITVFHPETAEMLDVNETYYELMGYDSLDELRKLGIDGLSVTEEGYTGERGRNLIRDVGRTGEDRHVEWCGETSDGDRVWLDVTLTAAEIGGERRVVSIQRDITERKRREREYEQIFESVEDGIVVWDPEPLEILDANGAYLEMLGYDSIDALRDQGVDGLSVTDEGYTEERGREIHRRVAETGEPELVEWRGETRDGGRLWLEVKVTPAVIGGEQRTISINRDITDRKRREQRLEVFNRVLRHNLRNHLDVIRAHAEVLGERTEGAHARRVIQSTDRLAAMGDRARRIDHFMARELRPDSVDIGGLVDDVLGSIEPSTHDVSVSVGLAGDTGLISDREILETLLSNALDNAIRYADSAVVVTGDSTDEGYAFEIDDDGPGIPADELAPLDAETETEFTHGRGLGLWQLKWGVTKLGGTLSFDMSDGTTVRIEVPEVNANGESG